MPDFRCYYADSLPAIGDTIVLSQEESNHLVAANRARPGSPVRLFNGAGLEWDARLERADKRKAQLSIQNAFQFTPPPYEIALAQALPKGKLLESIIRKATEIGIQRLFPVITQRAESKIDGRKEDAKNAKWTAATLEGAKQSGNPFLATIEPIQTFEQLLSATADYDLKLIASLAPGAASLKKHLQAFRATPHPQTPRIVWLVGPEGDFTAEETQAALAAGFRPTTLGPHVMRVETAAHFALSVTLYELFE